MDHVRSIIILIAVIIRADPTRPFYGSVARVYLDNQPIGAFRTQSRGTQNKNAVGDDYEVACNATSQQSVDRDPKYYMEGRWYNLQKHDLITATPFCV